MKREDRGNDPAPGVTTGTDHRWKRRSVLQSIGSVAGAIGISGTGVSQQLEEAEQLVGITYDTLTHRPQRRAFAEISHREGGVTGNFRIAGYSVEFGQGSPLEPVSRDGYPEYLVKKTAAKYREEDLPLHIWFNARGDHLVGRMTRPHKEYGKLAFTIGPVGQESTHSVVSGLKNGLMKRGEGVKPKGLDHVPEVPDSGIPKNTSFPAVLRGETAPAKKYDENGDPQ